MSDETLNDALAREHREIDIGIDAFVTARDASADLADGASGQSPIQALVGAIGALRRHIYLEEQFLFPPLRAAGLVGPIFVMLREHGQMWQTMDALEAAVEEGPAGTRTADFCSDLVSVIQAHNPKEELMLYPQSDRVLTPAENADLATFMAAGTLPEGWVCEQTSS